MPYVFPYEDLFTGLVAAVIIGLLLTRIAVTRRLRRQREGEQGKSDSLRRI